MAGWVILYLNDDLRVGIVKGVKGWDVINYMQLQIAKGCKVHDIYIYIYIGGYV